VHSRIHGAFNIMNDVPLAACTPKPLAANMCSVEQNDSIEAPARDPAPVGPEWADGTAGIATRIAP
jgi:hypothetical protein